MIRKLATVGLITLAAFGAFGRKHRNIIYAQSVPAIVHAHWTPNLVAENILDYVVTLDGIDPITVIASTCSATDCVATVSVPAFGAHVSSVVARNLLISTDPTSLQTSPVTTLAWSLNISGTAVGGLAVKK